MVTGEGDGFRCGKEGSDEVAVFMESDAGEAAFAVDDGGGFGVGQVEEVTGVVDPIEGDGVTGKFHAPALGGAGFGPVGQVLRGCVVLRYGKAIPCGVVFADGDVCTLEVGLARDGVHRAGDEVAHAG